MDHQNQFSVSHILGPCVDVGNYSTFQHQLHNFGNLTVAPAAHTLHPQDSHITATTNIVSVGYAAHAIQSYPAVINNTSTSHIYPSAQVQYVSFEAPTVSVRPHPLHTYHPHQIHLQPSSQSPVIKYADNIQSVNTPMPNSVTPIISKETSVQTGEYIIRAELPTEKCKNRKKPKEEISSAKLLRKKRRNCGEAYVNVAGRLIEPKKYVERDCQCKNKCLSKLGTPADRENIFNRFWALGDFDKQNVYMTENVILVPNITVKRKIPLPDERNLKTVTRHYLTTLPTGDVKVRVCKNMFLSLHGVSNGRLDRVLQAVNSNFPNALQDRRGHHEPSNKTANKDVDFAFHHILSLRKPQEETTYPTSQPHLESEVTASRTSHQLPYIQNGLQEPQHNPHLHSASQVSNQHTNSLSITPDHHEQELVDPTLISDSDVSNSKDLSVKKMYELYKRTCEQEGKRTISLWVYRQIERKVRADGRSSTNVITSEDQRLVRDNVPDAPEPNLNKPDDCLDHRENREIPERLRIPENEAHVMAEKNGNQNELIKMSRRERKVKRNCGEEYVTASGKLKKKKIYVDRACGCRYNCIPGLGSEEERRAVFDRFWALADFSRQNSYITQYVSIVPVMVGQEGDTTKATNKLARTHNRIYNVRIKGCEGGDCDVVRVCKVTFLRLHGVSNGRVDRVLQATAVHSPHALQDRRGQHPPKNKTPEEDLTFAQHHLTSIHQGQGGDDSGKDGAAVGHEGLTVKRMYHLYRQFCHQQGRTPIGTFVYRKMIKQRSLTPHCPRGCT